MIAIDTNILVYAHRPETPFHARAVAAVKRIAEAPEAWGVPMHCLVEFASVVTHPRIWRTPSSAADVEAQVGAWLESCVDTDVSDQHCLASCTTTDDCVSAEISECRDGYCMPRGFERR